jgi:hypothetical protein
MQARVAGRGSDAGRRWVWPSVVFLVSGCVSRWDRLHLAWIPGGLRVKPNQRWCSKGILVGFHRDSAGYQEKAMEVFAFL